MWPSNANPAYGGFVRSQVDALRSLQDTEVDVFSFGPGGYLRAAREVRARHGADHHDVIHAHFGLSAGPALAVRGAPHAVTLHGTDVRDPRSGRVTRALLRGIDLVATASVPLAQELDADRPVSVLPCGVDIGRFTPMPAAEARRALGLNPDEPFLLFPADPARAGKRHDLAVEAAAGTKLATLGGVLPKDVPLWVNAANAVVLPSDAEGFGLVVLEALACNVPVICTPVGIHPIATRGIDGCLCAPFDSQTWREAAAAHLAEADPRVDGRARASLWSAERMARRVRAAWSELTGPRLYSAEPGPPPGAAIS